MSRLLIWLPAGLAIGVWFLFWAKYYPLWRGRNVSRERRAIARWHWLWLLEFMVTGVLAAVSFFLSAGMNAPGGLAGFAKSGLLTVMVGPSFGFGFLISLVLNMVSVSYALRE